MLFYKMDAIVHQINIACIFKIFKMEKDELIFSSDCVMKLQDFGELKDYSETVSELLASIKKGKINVDLLDEILGADPEDTLYIPELKQVMYYLIKNENSLREQHKTLLLKLCLIIFEQSLFGSSWSDEFINTLLNQLNQPLNSSKKAEVLNFLFKLSDKIHYISAEDHNKIAKLILVIDLPENDQVSISKYIYLIDHFLRSRTIRPLLHQLINHNQSHHYITMKIHLWNKQITQAKEMLSILSFNHKSQILRKSIEYCSQYLDKLKN